MRRLQHLLSIVSWDEAVMMPTGGGTIRGKSMAELEVIMGETMQAPEVVDAFNAVDTNKLTGLEKASFREMQRAWNATGTLPLDLVESKALAQTKCEQAWRTMRGENNWKDFEPLLTEVVDLVREEAVVRSEKLAVSKYDALLDLYEPEAKAANIEALFAGLKTKLPLILEQALEKQKSITIKPFIGTFPVEKQKQVGLELMHSMGFDFNHGRLDVSHHPFCGGDPRDVRLTTRYAEGDFTQSLMGIVHETGHAMYEQSLPDQWDELPMGKARSMGIHESQSLLFEMQVGRSREFLQFLAPKLQHHLGVYATDADWSLQNIVNLYTEVRPDFIRVDADELTYPFHIFMRFEIERDLIDAKLEVTDLPDIWNEKMQQYLGIDTRGNYKDGCMQDVHWPSGGFGYFPTYTIGAMNAAQLFSTALECIENLPAQIASGDLSHLTAWLKENIWSKGSSLSIDELMISATGKVLDSQYFLHHLERRYL